MISFAPDGTVDVLIIGGGPSGLTAAAGLAERGAGRVLVVEREKEAGGIPRHSDHPGYGIRDLRRFISGPAYARELVDRALRAGAEIQTESMVTGWSSDGAAEITSPRGRQRIAGRAVILAMGARERPRSARLVPGDRPAGIYTTGQLQNLVHLHHQVPGARAVVVGAELVSWSAVMTLREAGCETVLMTSRYPRAESYAAFTLAGRLGLRVSVATQTRVLRIIGHGRVSGVEIQHDRGAGRQLVDCDTVVFTGDWIPDHELARSHGLIIDGGTLGPLVDTRQQTSAAGVFAVGNLTHPVDTADVAALDGRTVVPHVLGWLRGARHYELSDGSRLRAGDNLRWISPGVVCSGVAPPRDRLLAWPECHVSLPQVVVSQNGVVLSRRRLACPASPGRAFRIPFEMLDQARPEAEIMIGLARGRP